MKRETYEIWSGLGTLPPEREFQQDGKTYRCLGIRIGHDDCYQLRVTQVSPREYWAKNYATIEDIPEDVMAEVRALIASNPGIADDTIAFCKAASS